MTETTSNLGATGFSSEVSPQPGPPSPRSREARQASRTAEQPRSLRVPSRTALNYGLDIALTVSFLALAWLMTIPQLAFPAGQEAYRFRLWGTGIDDWRRFQMLGFCVFAFLVVLHVTLHWNWVCSVTNTLVRNQPAGRDNGSRTLIGVGLLIGLLHLLAATVLYAQFSLTPIE